MEWIVRVMTEHPLVAATFCFAVMLILYFLLKSLIRLTLILVMVSMAIAGYFYLRYPEYRLADLKDAVQKAQTAAFKAVDWGKNVYERGKERLDR